MPFTPKLTYKGKPLVRKDNELYYGRMTDPYVLRMQILSTKPVGGMEVADKVHIQVFSTNDSLAPEARVFRQTTKNGLYNALDIGSIWLQKANAPYLIVSNALFLPNETEVNGCFPPFESANARSCTVVSLLLSAKIISFTFVSPNTRPAFVIGEAEEEIVSSPKSVTFAPILIVVFSGNFVA